MNFHYDYKDGYLNIKMIFCSDWAKKLGLNGFGRIRIVLKNPRKKGFIKVKILSYDLLKIKNKEVYILNRLADFINYIIPKGQKEFWIRINSYR